MKAAQPVFLGVDVAGASNTWAAAIEPTTTGARVVWGPTLATLAEIVRYAERHPVVAVAIDAQLTLAVSDETGFRSGDLELRGMLPPDCCNWVQSVNSMMAVPVRGQLLAETLGPVVGTVIETHPRASLHFALGTAADEAIRIYKPARNERPTPATRDAVAALWNGWVSRFGIELAAAPTSDGPLDALVCATVALLYHREPTALQRLHHSAADRRGRGPFYVVASSRDGRLSEDTGRSAGRGALRVSSSGERAKPLGPSQDNPELAHHSLPRGVHGGTDDERITVTESTMYRDVVRRAVWCPACNKHPFVSWPLGWDAHAAHACSGLAGGNEQDRKAEFLARFRRLFK